MVGNFSNHGIDTFDPDKDYIGIRLQQGVPLLDRDWNELEDIRRAAERTIRQVYLGDGVPTQRDFAVRPAGLDDEVEIAPGHAIVAGFDVWSRAAMTLSEQGASVPLPPARTATDIVELWLTVATTRVDSTVDADLRNDQDVGIETCVRDRLDWVVVAVYDGDPPPDSAMLLARVVRRAGDRSVRDDDIADARRVGINLGAVSDRVAEALRRCDVLDAKVLAALARLEAVQRDVNELFWELSVGADRTDVLFGAKATVTVTVRNRNGVPIPGARLALSSDWGTLPTTSVTASATGEATFELVGVAPEVPFKLADFGVLGQVALKVEQVTLRNPGAIQFAKLTLDPNEVAVVSKYLPAAHLVDLVSDVASPQLVERPPERTATVTIHAMEANGAIVRGVGTVQIRFGQWVRPWMLSKLGQIAQQVQVEARVGDALRRHLDPATGVLDTTKLSTSELPRLFQSVDVTTSDAIKSALFDDRGLADEQLHGSGVIAQTLAQEATSLVGAATARAITTQVRQFEQDTDLPAFGSAEAIAATSELTQATAQLSAGLAQSQKQMFSLRMRGV